MATGPRKKRCPEALCGYSRAVTNQYYYTDREGRVHGPIWLSMMRDLYRKGRLMMSTEVSLNGTDSWQRLEFHPEIFEEEARMPGLKRLMKAKSDPRRLIIWTAILFLLYALYVYINWK